MFTWCIDCKFFIDRTIPELLKQQANWAVPTLCVPTHRNKHPAGRPPPPQIPAQDAYDPLSIGHMVVKVLEIQDHLWGGQGM